MTIKILITGGTIDDLEYDSPEKAPKSHKSLIPDLIKQARVTIDYDIEEIMAKDSKFITDNDRELIMQKCIDSKEDRIIITHGTMTMPETAKYLGQKNIPKTIVLFGSKIPGNKNKSDTLFNVGTAIMAVQLLNRGVYIAMNGKIFSWENVKKNFDKGIFELEK